jgi:hypothetical protein
MRYKLAPSLIAAGQHVTDTGMPFVARCDLFWPEHATDGAETPIKALIGVVFLSIKKMIISQPSQAWDKREGTGGKTKGVSVFAGASDPTQYIFLNDTLVAPIFDGKDNITNRTVWIPPGRWQDVWSGATVVGPKVVLAVQPWERQPMWHRAEGGLVVLTDRPGLRIEEGDWSSLTLELFPSAAGAAVADDAGLSTTERTVYAMSRQHGQQREKARTHIIMHVHPSIGSNGSSGKSNRGGDDGNDDDAVQRHGASSSPGASPLRRAELAITEASDSAARAWIVRMNLQPGEVVATATIDGAAVDAEQLARSHLTPDDPRLEAHDGGRPEPGEAEAVRQWDFPFGGSGSRPAAGAGPVLELALPSAAHARLVEVTIGLRSTDDGN